MELSSRHPEEGGIYVWTREAFGDFSRIYLRVDVLDEQPALLPSGALFRRGVGAVRLWSSVPQTLNANPLYYMTFRGVLAGT